MSVRVQPTTTQGEATEVDERSLAEEQRARRLALLALRRRQLSERCSAEDATEVRCQTLAIAQSAQEAEDLDFVESISIFRARGKR